MGGVVRRDSPMVDARAAQRDITRLGGQLLRAREKLGQVDHLTARLADVQARVAELKGRHEASLRRTAELRARLDQPRDEQGRFASR